MTILVTGVAGFIGMHVTRRLLAEGKEVLGIDNLNDYYEPGLKHARLSQIGRHANFSFKKVGIEDFSALESAVSGANVREVVHLAAQAGVRYSIDAPLVYGSSNLVGFLNVLELCRQAKVRHLVYASSSSVYGGNRKQPFSEEDRVDEPVSLYAATKRANELMARSYSHLYDLAVTGLRFFTVYGPWGRPDMAYYSFARAISSGEPINVYNFGRMQRDFTYIDDIVESLVRVLEKPPVRTLDTVPPSLVFNIGNRAPVELTRFIEQLESSLGKTAKKNFLPMQPGDVLATHADTRLLEDWIGFVPETPLSIGIERFAQWFTEYHHLPLRRADGAGPGSSPGQLSGTDRSVG